MNPFGTKWLAALFCAGVGSAVQHPLCSTIISHAFPEAGRRTAEERFHIDRFVADWNAAFRLVLA